MLAQGIDVAPTVTRLVGIPTHPAFQGIDLLSPTRQANDERLVFVHCCNPIVRIDAVISGTGWKYTYDVDRNFPELHFRPDDLRPHANLHATFPNVAASLREILMTWKDRQLVYYQRPRYYDWFYPPGDPSLDEQTLTLLVKSARHAATRQLAKDTEPVRE